MENEVLVVGGGVAGGSAILSLHNAGYKVTLVSSDPLVYSKMTLSYALKRRVTSIDPYVIFRPEDLKQLNVDFINDSVVYIDPDNRVIRTKSGSIIEFDNLVLATGSRIAAPHIEGIELKGVYTFLSFEDVVELDRVATHGRRAVIVGAGMIGLLAADSLYSRGLDVTLIDILPYPLMTAVEERIARIMLERLTARGVRFLGNSIVERIEGFGRVEQVVLATGDKIPADIVIISTGVRANVPEGLERLVEGPGNSVLTDEFFRTKMKNIYAIGDCASSIDYITERKVYRPLGIIASYEARLLPRALKGLSYRGFIPYQVEEAFGYYFIRLGLNGFEARRLGVSYSTALIEYKVPGLYILRSLVIYERGSGRVIGWQSIGPSMVSYKSKIFEDIIRAGGSLEDIQEKKIRIVCENC
ncbi:MAG: NAD(P)/FAD-dependent oxidoreductase [Sulfolobales archaeon]